MSRSTEKCHAEYTPIHGGKVFCHFNKGHEEWGQMNHEAQFTAYTGFGSPDGTFRVQETHTYQWYKV